MFNEKLIDSSAPLEKAQFILIFALIADLNIHDLPPQTGRKNWISNMFEILIIKTIDTCVYGINILPAQSIQMIIFSESFRQKIR